MTIRRAILSFISFRLPRCSINFLRITSSRGRFPRPKPDFSPKTPLGNFGRLKATTRTYYRTLDSPISLRSKCNHSSASDTSPKGREGIDWRYSVTAFDYHRVTLDPPINRGIVSTETVRTVPLRSLCTDYVLS